MKTTLPPQTTKELGLSHPAKPTRILDLTEAIRPQQEPVSNRDRASSLVKNSHQQEINSLDPREIAKTISNLPSSEKLAFATELRQAGVRGLENLNAENIDAHLSGPKFVEDFVNSFEATLSNLKDSKLSPVEFVNNSTAKEMNRAAQQDLALAL